MFYVRMANLLSLLGGNHSTLLIFINNINVITFDNDFHTNIELLIYTRIY